MVFYKTYWRFNLFHPSGKALFWVLYNDKPSRINPFIVIVISEMNNLQIV